MNLYDRINPGKRRRGWGGAVFRRWGSSWRRITQKVPKMQRSQQFSGRNFR